MRRWSGIAFGLLFIPSLVRAQVTGALDLGSGIARSPAGIWARESRLTPSLQFSHKYGFVFGDGVLMERAGALRAERASFDAAVASPALGPLRLSVAANASADSALSQLRLLSPDVTASVSAASGRGGIWMGTSMRTGRTPALVTGAWRSLGSAVISIYNARRSVTSQSLSYQDRQVIGVDTIVTDSGIVETPNVRHFTDTLRSSRLWSWSDLEGRVDWSSGRVLVSATFAGRAATDSGTTRQLWGRVMTSVRVADRLWLTSSAGKAPSPVGAPGARPRPFATLGVRLAHVARVKPPLPAAIRPAATAFAVTPAAPGQFRVVVHAPSARTVDVAGDFNGWKAIALHETSPGVWEVVTPLAPGTYQMSVRVDGDRWTAPPGMPSIDDAFNGRVGVVVVK